MKRVLSWLLTLLFVALSAVVIDLAMRLIGGLVVAGVDYYFALILGYGYVVWQRDQWAKERPEAGEQKNGNQENHTSQKRDARLRSPPVIRVYDESGNLIETHQHKSDFKEP